MIHNKVISTLISMVLLLIVPGYQLPGATPYFDAHATAATTPLIKHASSLGASALLIQAFNGFGDGLLTPISVADGKALPAYAPIDVGRNYNFAFSPDRQHLAIISTEASQCPAICLQLLDLSNWKEDFRPLVLSQNLFWDAVDVEYNPSGNRLAIALNNQADGSGMLLLVDLLKGSIARRILLNPLATKVAFTPDGDLALVGNINSQAGKDVLLHVALLDGSSLKIKWQKNLDQVRYSIGNISDPNNPAAGHYLSPATVFSPDFGKLYVIPADENRLITVDFQRHTISDIAIQPHASLLDRLMASFASTAYAKALNGTSKTAAISMDGKYLYVVGQTSTALQDKSGNWSTQIAPLGLQIIDASTGELVKSLESSATFPVISQDGNWLFLYSWQTDSTGYPQSRTDLFDLKTQQIVDQRQGEIRISQLLDGSMAWLSTRWYPDGSSELAVYRPGARTPLSQWKINVNDYSQWLPIN
jgi:hypothetical protein